MRTPPRPRRAHPRGRASDLSHGPCASSSRAATAWRGAGCACSRSRRDGRRGLRLPQPGRVDVVTPEALRAKLASGRPLDRQGRLRPDRPRHPSRPYRADAEDEALPGPWPPRGFRHRRLHRDDRRSRREARRRARPSPARRSSTTPRPTRPGLQDPRPGKTEIRFNREWLGTLWAPRACPPGRHVQRGAHARAPRLPAALRRGPADLRARVPLPAGPGLRLGGARGRRRAGRDRPALQPERRPRHHARLRPRAAGRADHAAPRRHPTASRRCRRASATTSA